MLYKFMDDTPQHAPLNPRLHKKKQVYVYMLGGCIDDKCHGIPLLIYT